MHVSALIRYESLLHIISNIFFYLFILNVILLFYIYLKFLVNVSILKLFQIVFNLIFYIYLF